MKLAFSSKKSIKINLFSNSFKPRIPPTKSILSSFLISLIPKINGLIDFFLKTNKIYQILAQSPGL